MPYNLDLKNSATNAPTSVLMLFAAFLLAGCSGGDEITRFSCVGSVVLDGLPVQEARLRFTPDASAGNSGPQSFSFVKDGQFELVHSRGLVEGPYQVEITISGDDDEGKHIANAAVTVSPSDGNVFTVEIDSKNLKKVPNEEGEAEALEDGEG